MTETLKDYGFTQQDVRYIKAKTSGEITTAPRNGRKFSYYDEAFGFSNENIMGTLILDVGAGDSDFRGEAQKRGAKIISLDPDYFLRAPKDKSSSVTGLAQYLPFVDNVFDQTIASWSLWNMQNGADKALREMIRVTKPGGKIKINPTLTPMDLSLTVISVKKRERSKRTVLIIHKEPGYTDKDWDEVVRNLYPYLNLAREDEEIMKKLQEISSYL